MTTGIGIVGGETGEIPRGTRCGSPDAVRGGWGRSGCGASGSGLLGWVTAVTYREPGRPGWRRAAPGRHRRVQDQQGPGRFAAYRGDPLVYDGRPTLGLSSALFAQFGPLVERSRGLRVPVLLQYGEHDEVVDPAGFRALEAACGAPDLTVHRYPGLWHEIYNEPERERPLADLADWLSSRAR
ncbi:hypothetical protein BJF78_12965 [Pseudonocardia sp. CNS-139]|nr:hypothetical protein BJF78_12965 [Pseudonocardia sp. CNS-139]